MTSIQKRLSKLLTHKKSNSYYAEKLGITVEEVQGIKKELQKQGNKIEVLEDKVDKITESVKENLDKSTMEVNTYYTHPPTAEEIIKDHDMSHKGYKLSSYYSKAKSKGWLVTALFTALNKKEFFENRFVEFLKGYSMPSVSYPEFLETKEIKTTVLINKQDTHLNKDCIKSFTSIERTTNTYLQRVESTLNKVKAYSDIEEVVYVIGSDQFNSEFTGMTVKGTKMENTAKYYDSFQQIIDHEVITINKLKIHAKRVKVIYLGGNHDQYVSWHMVMLLQAIFKNTPDITVDTTTDYTKYITIYDSAICLNHGDAQKPERLAQNFPTAYKEGFGKADHWYILTGDKHTEMSKQFGGIKFFQLPVQSKAISDWDSKNGYTEGVPEIQSFVFEKGRGMSMIVKEVLK